MDESQIARESAQPNPGSPALEPPTQKHPALEYPIAPPAGFGITVEIAPDVLWLRMPLPFQLDHINIWALEEAEGWAVVDTGTRTDGALATWRRIFAETTETRPLTRIFATHMHPDHIGLAGWLTRKFGCRLWMTRTEYLNCRVLVSDTGKPAPPDAIAFFKRCGWNDQNLDGYMARFGNFGQYIHPMPDSYQRLVDGQDLTIGAHDWRVIVGSGHSPEHACFHCPELKLLISGDQVLPRISSNVSVHPAEPDADPMQDWLDSLAKLKRLVPDDVLVLPSHNEPFRGLHARLDQLDHSQRRALARLHAHLAEPRRVIDVFGALFSRPVTGANPGLLGLATGESMACLNYLRHRDLLTVSIDADGVAWYQARGNAGPVLGE